MLMKPTSCVQCAYHARPELPRAISLFLCCLTILTYDAMCRTSLTMRLSAAVSQHADLAHLVLKIA